MELVDQVDVANLDSEAAHDYRWWQETVPPGFVTEVYRNVYQACGLEDESACWATDGGRVLTGGEEFTIQTVPGQDLVLVTRVHGRASVPLALSLNGDQLAYSIQPAVPARWIEIAVLVTGEHITGQTARIRIETQGTTANYSPYYHWVYQGEFISADVESMAAVARFGGDGTIRLLAHEMVTLPGQLDVTLTWTGAAPGTGDGIVFVHLYNQDNIHTEPVAQRVLTRRRGAAAC
jgi:hypothetical protein